MRQVGVFLLLCSAALTAAAQCNTPGEHTPPAAAGTHSQRASAKAPTPAPQTTQLTAGAQTPAALKVRVLQTGTPAEPMAAPAPTPAELPFLERLGQGPLGAPLLISALVMLVIALRRGSR